MSLSLWGHATSFVTWPFWYPYTISDWWSLGTKSDRLRVCLQPFFRELGSESIGVTWRHLSRDHFDTPCHFLLWSFGIGTESRSPAVFNFELYCTLSELGSRVRLFGVTWRPWLRNHLISHRPFPILVVLWNQRFWDIQRRMWCNGWHDHTTSKRRSRWFIYCNQFLIDLHEFLIGCQ